MSLRFGEDDLRTHRGRLVLEDHLAEDGLALKIRRVGCRFVVRTDDRARARAALTALAPDVDFHYIGPGVRAVLCPACAPVRVSDGNAVGTPQMVDVTGCGEGDRVACPSCGAQLEVVVYRTGVLGLREP